MKYLTYLIYIVLWEGLTIGGAAWLVIADGRSGWWLVFGVFLAMCAYSPAKWIHGADA